jgi:hypothetical protein
MNKLLSLPIMAFLVLSIMPVVLAVSSGTGIGVDIVTEDFAPMVWLCNDRVVLDDNVEPGRKCPIDPNTGRPSDSSCQWNQQVSSYTAQGTYLPERLGNYAFEGEQIVWDVIVFDKNGIEKIKDVYGTVGTSQGEGNPIEVNCILDSLISDTNYQQNPDEETPWQECNARIGEEYVNQFHDNTAAKYKCILTVETPESMSGEAWLTIEAEDLDGLFGNMDENEYWFLNPMVELSVDGDLVFDNVRPGAASYSDTILVGNDAEVGSGVIMDMFISGTDFYDSANSGAKCPLTNQLKLGDGDSKCDVASDFGGTDSKTDPFCYFATNGAYSSQGDLRNGPVEDYVGINYGAGFNDPNPFYGTSNGDATGYEIIQSTGGPLSAPYFSGNVLVPGGEMAVTFRLNLPEPCNGDFDTGQIYFWGEAI